MGCQWISVGHSLTWLRKTAKRRNIARGRHQPPPAIWVTECWRESTPSLKTSQILISSFTERLKGSTHFLNAVVHACSCLRPRGLRISITLRADHAWSSTTRSTVNQNRYSNATTLSGLGSDCSTTAPNLLRLMRLPCGPLRGESRTRATVRLQYDGSELPPLDEAAVRAAAWRVKNEGYGAIAVAYVFSFKNPAHELRTRDILREELGDDFTISLSYECAKEWREYERTSSAVIEAYTGPVVRNYLLNLETELSNRGVSVPLHVMQSSGGVLTAQSARQRPLQTLLSGPVGGAIGGEYLTSILTNSNLIGVDMGGTSFDVSLVINGTADVATEAVLEGLPMLMSVVNIHTIGAGGGSVAWVEAGGLRVGPRSAGATARPACYGRGGVEPTVTDANLVLGRVDADTFAGGQMKLDYHAAESALQKVGSELDLNLIEIAEGICDVANSQMAQAIRTITISRGIEPRDFSLVAFGGAGPMHAAFLAKELGIRETVVPRFPGAFSAWGMLQGNIRRDFSEPYFHLDADLDRAAMSSTLATIEREALASLESEGVPPQHRRTEKSLY